MDPQRPEHAGAPGRSETRHACLVEHANDAILLIDVGDVILEANRLAEALFVRPRHLLVGRRYDEFVPHDELEDSRLHRGRLMAEGTVLVANRHLLRSDGSRVEVEVSASLVDVEGARLVLAILRDVTERRRAEDAVRHAEERLRHIVSSSPSVLYTLRVFDARQK